MSNIERRQGGKRKYWHFAISARSHSRTHTLLHSVSLPRCTYMCNSKTTNAHIHTNISLVASKFANLRSLLLLFGAGSPFDQWAPKTRVTRSGCFSNNFKYIANAHRLQEIYLLFLSMSIVESNTNWELKYWIENWLDCRTNDGTAGNENVVPFGEEKSQSFSMREIRNAMQSKIQNKQTFAKHKSWKKRERELYCIPIPFFQVQFRHSVLILLELGWSCQMGQRQVIVIAFNSIYNYV